MRRSHMFIIVISPTSCWGKTKDTSHKHDAPQEETPDAPPALLVRPRGLVGFAHEPQKQLPLDERPVERPRMRSGCWGAVCSGLLSRMPFDAPRGLDPRGFAVTKMSPRGVASRLFQVTVLEVLCSAPYRSHPARPRWRPARNCAPFTEKQDAGRGGEPFGPTTLDHVCDS